VQRTGYDDFGQDDAWQEGLDRLLDALDGQEYLPGAVDRIEKRFTDALAVRLESERWIAGTRSRSRRTPRGRSSSSGSPGPRRRRC